VSFDFNVSYSSCWGYSLIDTLKLKNYQWDVCNQCWLCHGPTREETANWKLMEQESVLLPRIGRGIGAVAQDRMIYHSILLFILLFSLLGVSRYRISPAATYRVATISRLLKITGLFCKRALQKRRYSAKETYNYKEPTNRSHPIVPSRDIWMHHVTRIKWVMSRIYENESCHDFSAIPHLHRAIEIRV